MKRKMMALLLSMTLGATMLAGCGSGSSDSGDSSTTDKKEEAAADETDKEISALSPVLCERISLTLEEVFIYELGGMGYEFENIII